MSIVSMMDLIMCSLIFGVALVGWGLVCIGKDL